MTNPIVLLSEIILILFMLVFIASIVIFSLTRQPKPRKNAFGQEGHGYGYNPYIDIHGVQGKGGFATR